MAQNRKEITNYREIERIVYIHEQIASGKYPTTGKLAKELECSTSTISRDLEFLKDRCYAPYEYDSQKRGYYYTDPTFNLKFGTVEKAMNVEIADEKKSFAEYMNIPLSTINKLEEITELNLPSQTVLQSNLSNKYIGRNYFEDACTWLGLKAFKFIEMPLLCLAHFEDYKSNPKNVSFKLQGTKTEVARKELNDLIKFTRG